MIDFKHFLICHLFLETYCRQTKSGGLPGVQVKEYTSFEETKLQDIKILLNMKAAIFWNVTPCILIEMH
jgi:hypothetical protein